MNPNYTTWANDKNEGGVDEKFDPSFARHPTNEASDAYPSVEDVTAAAVATAQRQNARKAANGRPRGRGSRRGTDVGDDEEDVKLHEDQVRAAQEAVAAGLSQQHHHQQQQQQEQYTQEQKLAAAVAQGTARGIGGESPIEGDHEGKMVRMGSTTGTKRAIQNRNAQRAFRQRKEKYVKELEAKAAEVEHLKQSIEELRAENLQLRDYTLALQSRVIELSPSAGPGVVNNASNVQNDSNIMPTAPAVFSNLKDKSDP